MEIDAEFASQSPRRRPGQDRLLGGRLRVRLRLWRRRDLLVLAAVACGGLRFLRARRHGLLDRFLFDRRRLVRRFSAPIGRDRLRLGLGAGRLAHWGSLRSLGLLAVRPVDETDRLADVDAVTFLDEHLGDAASDGRWHLDGRLLCLDLDEGLALGYFVAGRDLDVEHVTARQVLA